MSVSSQMGRLVPLLDGVFQSKQTRLVMINRRLAELQQQLSDLDRHDRQDPDSPATRAGADILWDTWVQARRKLILQEMALAARDRENARADVSAALAKVEAARALQVKTHQADLKARERRSSW